MMAKISAMNKEDAIKEMRSLFENPKMVATDRGATPKHIGRYLIIASGIKKGKEKKAQIVMKVI